MFVIMKSVTMKVCIRLYIPMEMDYMNGMIKTIIQNIRICQIHEMYILLSIRLLHR